MPQAIHSHAALVTGASRGIGAAIARALAANGHPVAINYLHSQNAAETLADELNRNYGQGCAVALKADISDAAQASLLAEEAERLLGPIGILVNNAGIAQQKLLTDFTAEEWDRIFAVNVKGMFLTCKAVLPGMIRRRQGSIINLSSIWGITGASCEVPYSAAKAAVIGFTKALAKETGPSQIRVNCVAPGVILTDMNSALSPETLDGLREETPLERLGLPEDIAEAVLFLAEEKARFITGQILSPNGGIVI